MSNSTLKILPALMVAITAALVTQPMRATPINDLVITENSSTSLTAILNGNPLSVDNFNTDEWFVALAGINFGVQQNWLEPDAPGFVNNVFGQPGLNRIGVSSEMGPGQSVGLADGTTDTTTFTLNGNPLSVTFFDKGDVATVPDTGTTFSLLGLSLMGLGFLRRKIAA